MSEYLIIQITSSCASKADMVQAIFEQSGDGEPFFCPAVIEGEPYDGHAHCYPPFSATEASCEPIRFE